ncbi:MAG: mannosyl-3-phosphoglycerate synthase [Nitrososphaera sp.]|uniref:mannosyl-3-phosphoglycerate synthase n=1 Tax=Nitrososphaera sp. TaxID=1971748 RepID=UPI00185C1382|nr:mannosyl-3-phosphoglycerate synthase [Nitrososphaera sp.]NWG36960.1 mannosyl-3-phosphoglycerate synthase [Nitrososphaera sp.]
MKLDFPRYTERLGAVSIHAVQRIYELDSGKSKGFLTSHQTIKKFDYDEISNLLHDMAIVIPLKEERLKLLEGVLSGIPNECLVIIVSNSPRSPVDRYAMEVETVRLLGRFMDKRIVMIHQRDSAVGSILKKLKYNSILDSTGHVRAGKAEGMVLGLLIAKMYHKDYVGFIDADNYVPGAVNEYVKIFAAGFGMASSPYCNVRISWVFKPKVRNNSLQFSKWGRVSETTNKYLNSLLSSVTGFETDIIKTGNSGEHALSMPLADCLHYSSGYSIEPYEFVDVFEKFGGILPSKYPNVVEKGVEVFQIETRNPHFHEDKGKMHLNHMLEGSLAIIAASSICPSDLKRALRDQISQITGVKKQKKLDHRTRYPLIAPISTVPIAEFAKEVRENAETFYRLGGLK